ncbi:helix-turn-helix domain-containing protein [Rummeliibacillus sp. NPDC094406]|uniref:AraC family transcriptional regulator n=1 Tax=Rummeliibacillus sp. NPDC094406 TaxID=3364511 RepID=UPI003824AB2C
MNNQIAFYPIQPEWQNVFSYYRQINLPFPASQHIAYMYEFKINSLFDVSIPGIPDACTDLIFCSNGKIESNLVVASPPYRIFRTFESNVIYTGIRLLPQQRIFSFQIPLKHLFQNFTLPLFDVIDFPFDLYEQLISTPSLKEKAELFSSYFQKCNDQHVSKLDIVQACMQKITCNQGAIKLKELEQYTGFSERYLRNLFSEYVGLSPKQFLQLYRFQITVQKMATHNLLDINQFLMKGLFYDESHFYKEFKRYAKMTPKEYATLLNKTILHK